MALFFKTSKNLENGKTKTTFTLTTLKVVRVKAVLFLPFFKFLPLFMALFERCNNDSLKKCPKTGKNLENGKTKTTFTLKLLE